jgi:hypothetical protein
VGVEAQGGFNQRCRILFSRCQRIHFFLGQPKCTMQFRGTMPIASSTELADLTQASSAVPSSSSSAATMSQCPITSWSSRVDPNKDMDNSNLARTLRAQVLSTATSRDCQPSPLDLDHSVLHGRQTAPSQLVISATNSAMSLASLPSVVCCDGLIPQERLLSATVAESSAAAHSCSWRQMRSTQSRVS